MKLDRRKTLALLLPLLISLHSKADSYHWKPYETWTEPTSYSSPDAACQSVADYLGTPIPGQVTQPTVLFDGEESRWHCNITWPPGYLEPDDQGNYYSTIFRFGDYCEEGGTTNKSTGLCEITSEITDDGCDSNYAGNPINFTTGRKIQNVIDYAIKSNYPAAISFSRRYDSGTGDWSHNYDYRLVEEKDRISISHPNGKKKSFSVEEGSYRAMDTDRANLIKALNQWIYITDGKQTLTFDDAGSLIEFKMHGIPQKITTLHGVTTVSDLYQNKLTFTVDDRRQPRMAQVGDIKIAYEYEKKQLIRVTKSSPEGIAIQEYAYNDPRDAKLMTSMTDQRGIPYATWTYDNAGRVISSEHAGGAEKTSVAYYDDDSTTVTNELGKSTTYRFTYINGVKRITTIEGEPTPHCPKSNSTFAYDTQGFLKTQTDNKGNITTFEYNDKGEESSRTEANGTPEARTILTEWHPTFSLPTAITEPHRITRFTYDDQGRQLSQTVSPR